MVVDSPGGEIELYQAQREEYSYDIPAQSTVTGDIDSDPKTLNQMFRN